MRVKMKTTADPQPRQRENCWAERKAESDAAWEAWLRSHLEPNALSMTDAIGQLLGTIRRQLRDEINFQGVGGWAKK
jgi:hypothetical protein